MITTASRDLAFITASATACATGLELYIAVILIMILVSNSLYLMSPQVCIVDCVSWPEMLLLHPIGNIDCYGASRGFSLHAPDHSC